MVSPGLKASAKDGSVNATIAGIEITDTKKSAIQSLVASEVQNGKIMTLSLKVRLQKLVSLVHILHLILIKQLINLLHLLKPLGTSFGKIIKIPNCQLKL